MGQPEPGGRCTLGRMSHPTAEQILTTLNDGEPIDPAALEFRVITGYIASGQRDNYWPFQLGEVIVVDAETGREPFGEGRKPGKWSVLDFATGDYQQACALAEVAKSKPRYGAYE